MKHPAPYSHQVRCEDCGTLWPNYRLRALLRLVLPTEPIARLVRLCPPCYEKLFPPHQHGWHVEIRP